MHFIHRVDRSLLVPEPCARLRRLGSAHDGGYVVPLDAIVRARHLLAFGLAMNWDFERDALRVNPALALAAFDPSVGARRFAEIAVRSALSAPLRLLGANPRGAASSLRRVLTALDYFHFFRGRRAHVRKRVWYNADRDSAAIGDILSAARGPIFAKIDIEGSEYRILPWIIANADAFTGLVVEFHDTDVCAGILNEQLRQLREEFVVVHVHGNNYGDRSIDGALPLSLEITFLHRDLWAPPETAHTMHLDAPNDPSKPDYAIAGHDAPGARTGTIPRT